MIKQKRILFWAVIVMVTGTGGLLRRVQATHKLGQPGLKMVAEPVFATDGALVNTNTVALPLRVGDFTSSPAEVTRDELLWLPKDTTYGRRNYKSMKDGLQIGLSIVLMGTDRTSIHKPQICLTGQGWKIERSELTSVPVPRPAPYDLPVMKLTSSKKVVLSNGRVADVRGIYVYWFVSESRLTAKHGERMWWMASDLLKTGVLSRWAYVSFFATCLPEQEEILYSRMKDFIATSVPEFQLVHGTALGLP
jgi:hypothetical protein